MSALYPQMVDVRKPTISGLLSRAHFGMSQIEMDVPYPEIGQRLAAIRQRYSALPQRAWAEKHHFQPTQWNNWEKGVRRIPIESAEKLCMLYGLTLDFIYLGRRDGLAETASKTL